jgi:type I restriction enzyme S subunit
VKAGWAIKPLGEVCAFEKNQGIHKGLPYVGLEHIESYTAQYVGSSEPHLVKSSTFRFSDEHVLYGRLRPYLNKVLAPDFEGHCSTEIFPIKPRPELSREYLLYWLLADETCERINATCTGARMPRAQMNEVMGFDFPLPPLPEQHRIVAILDEAFDGIATATANAEKNLQNARALFESHLQSVFTERGEGWVETKMGDVCNFVRGSFGGSLKKSIFVADGYAVYEQQHAIYDQFDEIRYFVDAEKFSEMRRFELLPNDLIMSCSGTMGRVAIVPERIKTGIINQALLKQILFR